MGEGFEGLPLRSATHLRNNNLLRQYFSSLRLFSVINGVLVLGTIYYVETVPFIISLSIWVLIVYLISIPQGLRFN